jgi:YD repeat-containing protein
MLVLREGGAPRSRRKGAPRNDADQLLTYGSREYAWNAFGQLESMLDTATQEETFYTYDLYGNLLSVALPDGRGTNTRCHHGR